MSPEILKTTDLNWVHQPPVHHTDGKSTPDTILGYDSENVDLPKSKDYINLESQYGAHNYHPLPVVISKAEGIYMYDVEGKRYMDFLAAYSAVNQGHCHPVILKAMYKQAEQLTLTSRAFYNDQLGPTEKYLCKLFKYDKCLMMNSGAEAVETAIKLARRWGYEKKGIIADQACILTASDNFHGRTSTIVSFSTDPDCYNGFGPKMPGFMNVKFNDTTDLEETLKSYSDKVCAFMVEPIQGEAGAVVPSEDYLFKCSELCRKYNCLLICDEIQSGLGRAGTMLACYGEGRTVDDAIVRPDIICLGKAMSGGTMPISCVLADDRIMLCIRPGQHGSTFGGNPLACAVVRSALGVLINEKLVENSKAMGTLMKEGLIQISRKHPNIITQVRGRGLMLAIVIKDSEITNALIGEMQRMGLLCKPTHENVIRLSPPLTINEAQVLAALKAIEEAICNIIESRHEAEPNYC